MTDLRDLQHSRQKKESNFAIEGETTRGYLAEVNGSVKVPNRTGWVWAIDHNGGVVQAFNPRVATLPGLPVKIANTHPREGKAPHIEVMDVDWEYLSSSQEYDGNPYLKEHAASHEWRGGMPGPDAVVTYPASWAELMVTPASSGVKVNVSPLRYIHAGALKEYAGGRDIDLSSYQPASGLARWLLMSLSRSSGALNFSQGEARPDIRTTAMPIPPLPSGVIPAAYVRLSGDATALRLGIDIINARSFLNGAGDDSADQVALDTTNFDNILSASDDEVQAAMDTLDDFIANMRTAQTGDVVYYDGSGWGSQTPLVEGGRWLADNGTMLIVDDA